MTQPAIRVNSMPPNPAPMLAKPQTEATDSLGNASAVRASWVTFAPVYPAIATATQAVAIHGEWESTAGMDESISNAQRVRASFRAFAVGTPRRINAADSHPPRTLPSAATKNGIQAYFPIAAKLNL